MMVEVLTENTSERFCRIIMCILNILMTSLSEKACHFLWPFGNSLELDGPLTDKLITAGKGKRLRFRLKLSKFNSFFCKLNIMKHTPLKNVAISKRMVAAPIKFSGSSAGQLDEANAPEECGHFQAHECRNSDIFRRPSWTV